MADYAIGDVQGCYDALQQLLALIDFNERTDRLWFAGDLVNRGPNSLAVLRFVKSLPIQPRITLGNHDFHLLHRLFVDEYRDHPDDTLQPIMAADDREELGHWLRHQTILSHDEDLGVVMSHAGIAPVWTLSEAKQYALELEEAIQGERYRHFLKQMYGNQPNHWHNQLAGIERLRAICNYFTRMRFCNAEGHLDFSYDGTIEQAPKALYPWFETPHRCELNVTLVFGHWAALMGKQIHPKIQAIDTGCLWGGKLTALRLQDLQRFSVPCLAKGGAHA